MKKEREMIYPSKNPIDDICHEFFENPENVMKYGFGGPYDAHVFSITEGIIARGFRVPYEVETCREQFDGYLKNCGYTPENDGDIVNSVGSVFKGKFLPDWLKYSKPDEKDLWVSCNGIELDGWQDIFITTSPDQITSGDTSLSAAFSQALEKQIQVDGHYQRFDLP